MSRSASQCAPTIMFDYFRPTCTLNNLLIQVRVKLIFTYTPEILKFRISPVDPMGAEKWTQGRGLGGHTALDLDRIGVGNSPHEHALPRGLPHLK